MKGSYQRGVKLASLLLTRRLLYERNSRQVHQYLSLLSSLFTIFVSLVVLLPIVTRVSDVLVGDTFSQLPRKKTRVIVGEACFTCHNQLIYTPDESILLLLFLKWVGRRRRQVNCWEGGGSRRSTSTSKKLAGVLTITTAGIVFIFALTNQQREREIL